MKTDTWSWSCLIIKVWIRGSKTSFRALSSRSDHINTWPWDIITTSFRLRAWNCSGKRRDYESFIEKPDSRPGGRDAGIVLWNAIDWQPGAGSYIERLLDAGSADVPSAFSAKREQRRLTQCRGKSKRAAHAVRTGRPRSQQSEASWF